MRIFKSLVFTFSGVVWICSSNSSLLSMSEMFAGVQHCKTGDLSVPLVETFSVIFGDTDSY